MDTKTKAGFIAGGVLAAAGITLMIAQPKNQMTYEDDLLNGAAAYVEQYDDDKPADALQYLLQTIDVAQESNVNIQGLSQLEKSVSDIRNEVVFLGTYRNPPTLYHAALEETAGQARNVVYENTPSKAPRTIGYASLLAGALSLLYSITAPIRKKRMTP
ncbi:MAG: hypothetical protein PHO02_04170 [Candidatus Nanoarchaeia archaeon]|nr:hypothetical protein [Candidatus Nanoarchaeia archaeon]